MMGFDRPQDQLDYDRGLVEDYGFWAFVDSTPGAASTYNRNLWSVARDGEWCLAANSAGDRCSQHVTTDSPFCGFHLRRAWDALSSSVMRHEYAVAGDRLKRDLTAIAEGRGLDAALLHDLANAAQRLPERVYFFAAEHAVKIGRSVRPEVRVKTLGGTRAPEGVDLRGGTLLGTIPGGSRVELQLHQRFAPHRLVGEWFTLEPIRADIDALLTQSEVAA